MRPIAYAAGLFGFALLGLLTALGEGPRPIRPPPPPPTPPPPSPPVQSLGLQPPLAPPTAPPQPPPALVPVEPPRARPLCPDARQLRSAFRWQRADADPRGVCRMSIARFGAGEILVRANGDASDVFTWRPNSELRLKAREWRRLEFLINDPETSVRVEYETGG